MNVGAMLPRSPLSTRRSVQGFGLGLRFSIWWLEGSKGNMWWECGCFSAMDYGSRRVFLVRRLSAFFCCGGRAPLFFAAEAGRACFFLQRPGAVFAVPGALRGRSTRDAIVRENAWTLHARAQS